MPQSAALDTIVCISMYEHFPAPEKIQTHTKLFFYKKHIKAWKKTNTTITTNTHANTLNATIANIYTYNTWKTKISYTAL